MYLVEPVEISTKERLTGALIVVLALVVIAPEMLSGRHAPDTGTPPAQDPEDGPPLQTFNVALDASATEPVVEPEVPAEPAAEVAAGSPPVAASPPAATPRPAVSAPAPAPAPAPARVEEPAKPAGQARPADSAATSEWWVQVGSYSSRDNAQREAQKLRTAGYKMQVSQTRQSGKDLYRVRAGPVADRAAATALRARLIADGQKNPTLVAP